MLKPLLSLLLSMQLLLSQPLRLNEAGAAAIPPHKERLMWGLIDPELSVWFALLPDSSVEETDAPVLWDWSWRGLLASIFGDFFPREASQHGAQV